MAGALYYVHFYRNYDNSDSTKINVQGTLPCLFPNPTTDGMVDPKIGTTIWEAPEGTDFIEWNTQRDGSGTSVSAGYSCNNEIEMLSIGTVYAIWGVVADPIDYLTTDQELTSIANAIRTKGGTSVSLVYPTGFVSAIQAISTGTDVSDTTAVEGDVLAGKYFYKASGSATTPATTITTNPSITVSSSGLITATNSKTQSVTPSVSAGYVSSGTAGTITVSGSNTSQLITQAAQTITPGTTNQTIASGRYLTGAQTILGDADLVAGNIKKDVQIFGVIGTYEGASLPDATGEYFGTAS